MIETMTTIVSLAQQLYDLSETVKANGAQCRLLVEHVHLVSHSVRGLDQYHAARTASPFFAALYPKPCDQAFTNREGVFCVRYMDDGVLLVKTKRQFIRAKRRLINILRALGLKLSPRKTKMGALKTGFHWCGVEVARSRNRENDASDTLQAGVPRVNNVTKQAKNQVDWTAQLHRRSCRRALDRVMSMKETVGDAVHPAHIQRYLNHWATWWRDMAGESRHTLLTRWVDYAAEHQPQVAWLGAGLLPWAMPRADRPVGRSPLARAQGLCLA